MLDRMSDFRNSGPESEPANQVFLRGLLVEAAVFKTLATGERLCQFRVNVPRPPGERARMDSIDCSSRRSGVLRAAQMWEPGDELVLTGSLHRRFWRGPSGVLSRYEVDVLTARTRPGGGDTRASPPL
jgi:single-strand DNA-binding protein